MVPFDSVLRNTQPWCISKRFCDIRGGWEVQNPILTLRGTTRKHVFSVPSCPVCPKINFKYTRIIYFYTLNLIAISLSRFKLLKSVNFDIPSNIVSGLRCKSKSQFFPEISSLIFKCYQGNSWS